MDVVYLCPKCGSGKTGYSKFGDDARCLACRWEGKKSELMAAKPVVDDQIAEVIGTGDTALRIAQEVSRNYLLVLSESASAEIGRAMIRAGVVGGNEDPHELGRIIKAATLAAHRATLQEINSIQLERMKRDDPGD